MSNVHTLLVVWQNKNNRLYYHIGTLSYYNNQYEFTYTHSEQGGRKLGDAIKNGYIHHPAFPNPSKVYRSNTLFPAFDRRLPSNDRSDFKAILSDLGLDERSTKMDLLQQTRGRLASDTYSFEQPLRLEKDGKLHSSFFVHGMRHRNLPDQWYLWLAKSDSLKLIPEPTNNYDPNAVGIYTQSGKHLGYVPNFYSKAVFSLLENGATPSVRVVYLNEKSTPHWWLKVDFECEIPSLQGTTSDELAPVMQ
ncbi:HIRAN domain-containing protein [Schinkia azotoformans]|uniref:HIRAN domain-containing protein n=1 Tax=Schinkia azotoformans TaxID=1454 RepID=UPI002DBC1B44|nr:HIRAN domain-containing protein [Schinkia azotoformans]MEC1741737.1 HIRAN domain-containing protein [Schinkia azotoformans]MEC1747907.1 HIRAN domain-containing protein [Schinkia azotoformans]MEC1760408.1 HIRAN domain-containing protein [Schinkia azotoformans]MEC1766585.1 HIRAN domain-containing protein [Schinkia azotoformans]MEC1788000.1 HIRAN domain-containing protein [Schinkia azotoformans]